MRKSVRHSRARAKREAGAATLLDSFIKALADIENYKDGKLVVVDGHSLSISAITAAARWNAPVRLSESVGVKARVSSSRAVISRKVESGLSIYGVSTGFGGSADTRTDNFRALGTALLQHQHAGVLPSSTAALSALPLLDPLTSTSMPESWVRGAILIRMNSLIRGHSGVRWKLIENLGVLLRENITPLIPLRSSISASGDLSSLSYIAGTLVGNPSIRVFDGHAQFGARKIVSSQQALTDHGVLPLPLDSKEHLGILNGTAFSASTAAMALTDAVSLTILAHVLTAMGTEALAGVRGSFHQFIHAVARPHPGQVESARIIWDLLEGSQFASTREEERTILQDYGELRQDRYPLRTAPQFLGPQIEDILHALSVVTIECNSTTDNPLIDGETGHIHHGGNFQAMAISNAMEKTRLALHHIGKIMFAQATQLSNPAMNNGLPPNLAATDPSLNYFSKGIDIAIAAYISELGYLANPVTTHITSAEMHNQAVNSLALISARATINTLEVLSLLMASYLYILCQALDLRALQHELFWGIDKIVAEELDRYFCAFEFTGRKISLLEKITKMMRKTLDSTSSMDAASRMHKVAHSSSDIFIEFFASYPSPTTSTALASVPAFQAIVAARATALLAQLQRDYLSGARGPAPASAYLNRTRPVYEFVRVGLGLKMHGTENMKRFEGEIGVQEETIGQNISRIHEAIRDGKLQSVIVNMFDRSDSL